jgi:hypothetical protein
MLWLWGFLVYGVNMDTIDRANLIEKIATYRCSVIEPEYLLNLYFMTTTNELNDLPDSELLAVADNELTP